MMFRRAWSLQDTGSLSLVSAYLAGIHARLHAPFQGWAWAVPSVETHLASGRSDGVEIKVLELI